MSEHLIYCRLCASQKPTEEITDLNASSETRESVIGKLISVNVSFVDFTDKALPETICMTCLSVLDVVQDFLNKIRLAQSILNNVFEFCKLENDNTLELSQDDFYCDFDSESSSKHDSYSISQNFNTKVPCMSTNREVDNNFKQINDHVKNIDTKTVDVNNIDDYNLNTTWSSYPWVCRHCKVSLDSMEAVREHTKEVHGVCNGLQCADCEECFEDYHSFVDHVRGHRECLNHFCDHCHIKLEPGTDHSHAHNTDLCCTQCGELFTNITAMNHRLTIYQLGQVKKKLSKKKMSTLNELLSYGVKIYEPNLSETWKEYPWICKYCSVKIPDQDTLRRHVKDVHGKCFGFKCIDCSKNLSGFEEFVEHVRTHRPNLMYYCHYCNCKLENIKSDITHIQEHLSKDLCRTCGTIFNNHADLQKHISAYNPPKTKRIQFKRSEPITVEDLTCNICFKVSKSRPNFLAHQKLHTNRQREHTCDRCGMAFFTKGALKTHNLIHEKPEPEVCLICKKSFLTLTRLKKHLKTHNAVKPFQCAECQRCFRLKEHLKEHLIVHTDLLPYQCSYCDKAFKYKNVLKVHEFQHTGARPYNCLVCEMDFSNWSNCNKHMKRKHSITLAKNAMTPQGKVPLNLKGKTRKLRDPEVKEWAERIMVPCKRGKKAGDQSNTA